MSDDATARAAGEPDDESSSADSEGDEEQVPVESLVEGRSKRVTAGNRLSSLLEQEGDDELELLFAENEEEEDVEFEGGDGEDASDVQLDTSSDEDDQGPAQAEDDFEGEKELQKQDRAEQRKKRKAQSMMPRPGPLRKKVKVDPTATGAQPTTPAPRQRKKSERINWLPAPEEGPTRSSSRKQTVENKTVIHERMKESERRRVKQIKVMEAAAKRKEASRPKAMTQADRMAEAARMEKKNARSLNRWEETEKKRAEEQRAKLEALHNRQLNGPVITWWSGLARWVNSKLGQVGIRAIKAIEVEAGPDKQTLPEKAPDDQSNNLLNHDTIMASVPELQPPASAPGQPKYAADAAQTDSIHPQGAYGFLDGIHYYASLPTSSQQAREPPESASPQAYVQSNAPAQPSRSVEYSSRNLVIMESIDANAVKLPELQNHLLLKRRNGKPPSKSPVPSDKAPYLTNKAMQNPCKNRVLSPITRPNFAIPRLDCLTRTHTPTKRSRGSEMAGHGGAVYWDAMSDLSPVLLEAYQKGS